MWTKIYYTTIYAMLSENKKCGKNYRIFYFFIGFEILNRSLGKSAPPAELM